MAKKQNTKRSRVASEILEGLTELHEAVPSGASLDHTFTVRTVELVLKPKDLDPEEIRVLHAKLPATNDLGDGSHSSPAVSGDKLLLLGAKNIYCVGHAK